MLRVLQRHDAVDARLHRVPAGETERVAHVDDRRADLGRDEAELRGSWKGSPSVSASHFPLVFEARPGGFANGLTRRSDLETPLLAEEQSQRADIGVLLVSDVLLCDGVGRRDVVHHGQCRC